MEKEEAKNNQNRELTIDSNEINVSNRKNSTLYVFICKKCFEKYDTVVLNALGNATSVAVMAAENLVRNGYAEYEKIETQYINPDQRKNEKTEGDARAPRQKAKLLITLKKAKNFEENLAKFNAIRDENLKHIAQEKEARAPKTETK